MANNFVAFGTYRIKTTANREFDVMFKGKKQEQHRPVRLWFVNLDAPYEDIFLKPRWIKSATPLSAQTKQGSK